MRKNRLRFPEDNGPARRSLPYTFFRVSDTDPDDVNPQEIGEENTAVPAEWEDAQSCESS